MAPAAVYDRLSGLDESFLHLERPETPMHVGAMAVLEREPFYDARGRFRLDAVRALVASRLQLIPRFRKRVMAVPLGQGRPVWVDHEGFDIADHVRVTALPAPGTRRQLRELAERLTMQVLDRRRPLWELW
jgi:diacylglycerol O-acyltransferase / wax synthase